MTNARSIHPEVAARLARLTPDQRAAATAPPGPVLCLAPAGSGKTTTLVARIAWLAASGADPATIVATTFNRRAAVELGERLDAALAPLGLAPGSVRVRTFHALGLEIVRSTGRDVDLADRDEVLRAVVPDADAAERGRLDIAISRLKLEHRVTGADVAADPEPGPTGTGFAAYELELERRGVLDFDDLLLGALRALEADATLLARWRASAAHVLVDEVQDVDRAQLDLALLLAAPANRIFLVGDDDQTIYGWRLADVRRVLALERRLPGLRRVDLVTNFRCPAPVVERAVRLVEHNTERFAKTILARDGATGRLLLAPDPADEPARSIRLLDAWPDDGTTCAFLARTNRELRPAVVAALVRGRPFRAAGVDLLVDDPALDGFLDRVARETDPALPLLVRLGQLLGAVEAEVGPLAVAVLGWAPPFADLAALRAGIEATRARLAELRRDDARLVMATAHGTKGLEFDHVAVVGMEEGRFPSGRSVSTAAEPARALEEERRLGYVAWTRARVSLTLSYDPAVASPFLLEAFTPAELGLEPGGRPV